MTGTNGNGIGSVDDDSGDDNDDDVFRADPLLPALERGEQDEYFSLGLVMNWPLHRSNATSNNDDTNDNDSDRYQRQTQPLLEHYESFCTRVKKECFPHPLNQNEGENESATMFLPLESLHITVATLVSATKMNNGLPQQQQQQQQKEEIIQRWKKLLVLASLHEDWPKSTKPLQLKITGALITKTAGILLWDDPTNGISKIRQCLHSVVDEQKQKQQHVAAGRSGNNDHGFSSCHYFRDGFRTPDIIHTTFLRYRTPPPAAAPSGLIRPSQANSILQRNIVCSNKDNDNDNIPHPLFHHRQHKEKQQSDTTTGMTCATTTTTTDTDTVYIDCAKMVNCKIYLQPPKSPKTSFGCVDDETNDKFLGVDDGENYHEVYLTLPVGCDSTR